MIYKTETLIEAAGGTYKIHSEDIEDERRQIARLQAQVDERNGKIKASEEAQAELLKAQALRLDREVFAELVAIDEHYSLMSVEGKYAEIQESFTAARSVNEHWSRGGGYSYERRKMTGYYVSRDTHWVRIKDGVVKGKSAGRHHDMVSASDLAAAIGKFKAVTDAE